MLMKNIMKQLQEIAVLNGPLCVGLDTDPSYIPESVKKEFTSSAEAVLAYNKEIIKNVAADKSAACFKIQIAYYEAMGLEGIRVYIETLKAVKAAGMIAISDIKRGDIANTAAAYARAHFTGDFETDIITINPYMGFDTLTPFTNFCKPENGGKGLFVLLRTSNPGMTDIEGQSLQTGKYVLELVGTELNRLSKEFSSYYKEDYCSPIGAVVGCTEEKNAREIRNAYPEVFFLIPGYGAQGGAAKIAATLLDKAGGVVNSSRGILCAWKKDNSLSDKREKESLTLSDIGVSAAKAAQTSKSDLLAAKKLL